jgi:hypothetical protein
VTFRLAGNNFTRSFALLKGCHKIALVALALITFTLGPVAAAPDRKGPPDHVIEAFKERFEGSEIPGIQRAIEAQERHTNALLEGDGVVGTAVGIGNSGDAVVKVFIELHASAAGIPETLDGIPVVVEATGRIYALNIPCDQRADCEKDIPVVQASSGEPLSQRDEHPRPVPIGVSIGPANKNISGTLGCRVSDGCHQYALTNNHVVAGENSNFPGLNILQPGRFDGGLNPSDKLGELADFIPIVFSTNPSTNNRVDAALVDVTINDVGTATRSDGYGEPKSVTSATAITPSLAMNVRKYGRTTAQTDGYIDAVNATVDVEYTAGLARFKGQLIIKKIGGGNFSAPGDSGSLIVANGGAIDRQPVGLLFASGTEIGGAHITIANPIDEVLSALGVTIEGE